MMIHSNIKKCGKPKNMRGADTVTMTIHSITPNIHKLGISLRHDDIPKHKINLSNSKKTVRYKFLPVSYVQKNKHNIICFSSSLKKSWNKQCHIIDTIREIPRRESVLQKHYMLSRIELKHENYIY